MAAGDLVYSLESFVIDSDNRVVLRTSSGVVGNGNTRHPLRPTSLTFTPSAAQLAQITALRDSILASLAATPPAALAGQTHVPATTQAARKAARDAARDAVRAARNP